MEFKIGNWTLSNEMRMDRTVNIQTMDSKSMLANAPFVAHAVAQAIRTGESNSLVSELRAQTRTQ